MVRTHSPVEFLEEERLHMAPLLQNSEDNDQGPASGPSQRQYTVPTQSQHIDLYQEAIGLTFCQQILAYAAAQRRAETHIETQTQIHEQNLVP